MKNQKNYKSDSATCDKQSEERTIDFVIGYNIYTAIVKGVPRYQCASGYREVRLPYSNGRIGVYDQIKNWFVNARVFEGEFSMRIYEKSESSHEYAREI